MSQRGLRISRVRHRYGKGPVILNGVDVTVGSGEAIALVGPSGSGKTTLLSIMGLLTRPVDGSVVIDGVEMPQRGRQLDAARSEWFAWVFQTVNALGQRTALDNAALGLLAQGVSRERANRRALDALVAVGLAERQADAVDRLSGGELQRVCIARAMATTPRFVLADEPTGQLDRATSKQVLDALWNARSDGTSLVVATHDSMVAERCDRVLRISDGRVVDEETP